MVDLVVVVEAADLVVVEEVDLAVVEVVDLVVVEEVDLVVEEVVEVEAVVVDSIALQSQLTKDRFSNTLERRPLCELETSDFLVPVSVKV